MRPQHRLSGLLRLTLETALISAALTSAAIPPFTCPAIDSSSCPLPQPPTRPSTTSSSTTVVPTTTDHSQHEPPQQPKKDPSNPWSRGPICRRAGHDEFCAFTHSTFSNGLGISLITTTSRMLLLGSQRPLNETVPPSAQDLLPPPYKDVHIPGKGIGLVATELIRSGRRVMAATPAVMVDDGAFRGLRKDDLATLLAQAIIGLPTVHSTRFLNLSGSTGAEESQLDLIHKIFSTNAFRTPVVGADEAGKETDYHSTFTEVSRLNHACAPNLGYYFDTTTLSHKIYAVRDVHPGEELTISYVDVLQPSSTRQSLLQKTWSFTCTCERCTQETHLLAESDSRCAQLAQLRRELADTSVSATPEKAELFVTLFELEGLHVRIYEAYYRAAIEWNGVGDSGRAIKYARLCLDRGLLLRGERRPFVDSMRELVGNAEGHWSWRFRLKQSEEGTQEQA